MIFTKVLTVLIVSEIFDVLLRCLGLIIVDVFTQWAGPCDVMKPIINKVKSSVTDNCWLICVKDTFTCDKVDIFS